MQRVRKQIEVIPEIQEDWMKKSVTIAVLDTGIGKHPDLNGKVLQFRDFIKPQNQMNDFNGHGTHVCGILSGTGSLSAGEYRGIAPNSRLVVGKVLDDNGDGITQHMLEGLSWVIEKKEEYNIRILNISVGIGNLNNKEKEEALQRKIEEAWDKGIVVICAAGNKGPKEDSISAIGGSKKVITVGCHDGAACEGNEKRCETYSGRGLLTSLIRKPDLVAPGTDIMSCNVHYQNHHGIIRNPYLMKSGTSMATPIVSGAVALLLQKYPHMDNMAVKEKLHYTATDLGEPWNKQGWGMLNVKRLLG
ncbi:S8 family peptidase [Lachnospiraceae bacterium OttesenSCG-928-D06]|nr:S8 family peptidase [Lachnospiraceae bacterium OttesenSCG-928-D06]